VIPARGSLPRIERGRGLCQNGPTIPLPETIVKRFLLAAGLLSLALSVAGCGQDSKPEAGGTGNKAVALQPEDRSIGNPNAPIQFVEYAAPSCPHCARFNAEVFPYLKRNYIDTGKVFYVFRVFPLGKQDIAAESLARCMPKENYFAFIDLMFRKQDVWDPEFGISDVQGGLVQVANSVGMDEAKAKACIANSQAIENRVNKNAEEAVEKYNLNSTPTFVINGTVKVGGFDQDSLKNFLDPLLSKK
jgi:protein-disulfide isomerase